MRPDIPAELIFLVAILLTVGSLTVYGLIIKRLLGLLKIKYIWIFPMLGGLLLFVLVIVHLYRMLFYFPMLGTAGPADLFELVIGSLSLARVESYLLFGSGAASAIGGLLYYLASSR